MEVTRPCYISLHFMANPANCFVGICSSSLVNNLKPSRANTSAILSEVLPLPSQLLCYWLIIGFFAVIVPRIVEQLQQLFNILPQVSVRLRAWFDWLQSVIPGPMLEQFRSLRISLNNFKLG